MQRPLSSGLSGVSRARLKYLLVLDALFFGISSALTTGLLFVYLVSVGAGITGISVVVGLSAVVKLAFHLLLYRHPRFLCFRTKQNFVLQYILDRILFILIPLTQNYILIAVIYAAAAATPTNSFMNLTIFGSFSESDIKDVTAKRTSALGVSSIIGFLAAMFLLAFLPTETKFFHIYLLGALIGLACPLIVGFMDLAHLEGVKIPRTVEQPERLFSTSTYFVAVLAGGSLLSMVWVPYVMEHLNAPDYLAVAMNMVTTLTSIFAALICKGWRFKTLRYSVGLDSATPFLALLTPFAIIHPVLSAFSSFAYTGANFVGSFLFAEYKRWFGAMKSSILIVIIMCLANLLVASMSIFIGADYVLLFSIVSGIKLSAFLIALTTIPELAVVPEETARTYSFTMYNRSITGYQISVEVSRDAIMTTLKLIAFSTIFLVLYVIYRVLFALIS